MGLIKNTAVTVMACAVCIATPLPVFGEELSGGIVTEIEGSRFLSSFQEYTFYVGEDLSYIDYLIEVVESQNMIVTKDGELYTIPLSLEWDMSAADTSAAGSFNVTGTIIPPDGCTFAEGVLTEVIMPFTVIEKNDEPQEIVKISNLSLFTKGEMITAGNEEYWEECVQCLSDTFSYMVGCTENEEEAVLYADDIDVSEVDIDTPGEYRVYVHLALYPEYEDSFILSESLAYIEIPYRIAAAEELTLWISSCTPDTFEGVFSGSTEDYPAAYYAVSSENSDDAYRTLSFLPAPDEMVICGRNVFRITRSGLITGEHYYFYLDDGVKRSNYIHIYDDGSDLVYETMGGDRDGGDAGGAAMPDLIQPAAGTTPSPSSSSSPSDSSKAEASASVSTTETTTIITASADKEISESKPETTTEEEETETIQYEQSTSDMDIISGQRLMLALEHDGAAVFSKHGITVKIPEKAFEGISIEPEDAFCVEILQEQETVFSVKISLNGTELTEFENMQIMVPYEQSVQNISVTDENGQHRADGVYDELSHTVSFTVNRTGRYMLSAGMPLDVKKEERPYLIYVVFAGIAAIAVFLAGSLLHYRRKRTN